ncbi:tRNA lysidine(34) synthetase TilS [Candidatus Bipolaricaulota bacterium]|nr:tRNA lysidine(34) synthetase TilS [Candidatus Bipolaricaulota bacterium]
MLLERVKETIERYAMLEQGERVLVAVSGGVDSVVLLDVLCRLATEYSLELTIAHLDHGLRGEAAREDARFVARLARKEKLAFIEKHLDVAKFSKEKRIGIEEGARLLRRDFLRAAANEVGATKIALGHTQNDRGETLLFNLIRGAGPTGLVGIRPVNRSASRSLIRPLIEISREEILSYARSRDLPWREDRTNQDLSFSRNRIRHRILPLLREMNPRILAALQRTANLLATEELALDDLLAPLWAEVLIVQAKDRIVIQRGGLSQLSKELQALLLRRGIARLRGDLQGIEKVHIDALLGLVASHRAHGKLDLPGFVARFQGDELTLEEGEMENPLSFEVPIALGRTEIPSLGISLDLSIEKRIGSGKSRITEDREVEVADADRVQFPLHLRGRRPGDRFAPLGLGGEKKLKDFYIDERVPFYDRDRVPLLCDRQKIIWVVGLRLSDAVRVTSETKKVLIMRKERLT